MDDRDVKIIRDIVDRWKDVDFSRYRELGERYEAYRNGRKYGK